MSAIHGLRVVVKNNSGHSTLRWLIGLPAAWAAVFCASCDVRAGFIYIKVVDSSTLSSPLNNVDSLPQINSNDQVAVLLRQSSNGFRGGITSSTRVVRWQDGSLSTILSTGNVVSGGTIQTLFRPAISDNGNIAVRASYSMSGGGVLMAGVTGVQPVFNDTNFLNVVGINDDNRVVTSIQSTMSSPIEVQSRVPGGPITIHAANAASGNFVAFSGGGPPSPDINNNGDVALRGTLRSTFNDGIYLSTPSGIQTVADASDGFAFFGNNVELNDSGDVAFLARTTSDPAGKLSVYLGGVGQAPTLIASQSDFTSISEAGPAINDAGTVLFQAIYGGSSAIFSGGNPLTDRIIGGGDSLDGGTITSVNFGRGMLSDSGNFVFYSEIDDTNDGIADRSAVFYASVAAVPEPTSIVLFCTAAVVGSAAAVRRRVVSRA